MWTKQAENLFVSAEAALKLRRPDLYVIVARLGHDGTGIYIIEYKKI